MPAIKYKDSYGRKWQELFKNNIEVFLKNSTLTTITKAADASGYIDISSITKNANGCFIYFEDQGNDNNIRNFIYIWIGNIIIYNYYDSSNEFSLKRSKTTNAPTEWLFDVNASRDGKTYILNYYLW